MTMISERSESAQSFAYEKKGNSAVIWRCFSRDTKAVIPEQIDGLAVTELAPYAFSAHMDGKQLQKLYHMGKLQISGSMLLEQIRRETGSDEVFPEQLPVLQGDGVEEIVIPASVIRAGRYCFYNCSHLRRLSFTSRLADWGSGTFTGCHRISEIEVNIFGDEKTALKDLLDEVLEEVQVTLRGKDTVKIMIPEFYEEGIENYEARIIDTKVHGSGMRYRNCFRDREIDFLQYDRMFPYAVAQEADTFAVKMVLCRLQYPKELSDGARDQYERYLLEHPEDFAAWLTGKRDLDGIREILDYFDEMQKRCGMTDRTAQRAGGPASDDAGPAAASERFIECVIELAGKKRFAEGMSLVMDYRRTHSAAEPRKRRRMEL